MGPGVWAFGILGSRDIKAFQDFMEGGGVLQGVVVQGAEKVVLGRLDVMSQQCEPLTLSLSSLNMPSQHCCQRILDLSK